MKTFKLYKYNIKDYDLMLEYLATGIVLVSLYIYYRFSYAPKTEINRYKAILQQLEYRVYEQPFTFLGLSIMTDFARGKLLYKDVQYFQKTVYP